MSSPGCRVLAFARDWSPQRNDHEARALRGHLRGLGAELVIVGAHQAWRVRPDDDPWLLGEVAARELHRDHGVKGEDAVLVLDHEHHVIFEHRQPTLDQPTVLAGLTAATEAMLMPAPITFTRRGWVATCVVAGFSAAVLAACRQHDPEPAPAPTPAIAPPVATHEIDIVLDINGSQRKLKVEPRVSLLDALRERLDLPGTKKGCDAGQCGACTVHIDGKRVLSCLTLAAAAQGKPITTIEGLAQNGELHAVQKAFIAHDGMQCGFCTPGQIMSAAALIKENRATTDDEIREQMSGNICRCGAYPNILASIKAAKTSSGGQAG
jgi:xanthine dehydrogenase YagT iron-sulfur-binding subunit